MTHQAPVEEVVIIFPRGVRPSVCPYFRSKKSAITLDHSKTKTRYKYNAKFGVWWVTKFARLIYLSFSSLPRTTFHIEGASLHSLHFAQCNLQIGGSARNPVIKIPEVKTYIEFWNFMDRYNIETLEFNSKKVSWIFNWLRDV